MKTPSCLWLGLSCNFLHVPNTMQQKLHMNNYGDQCLTGMIHFIQGNKTPNWYQLNHLFPKELFQKITGMFLTQ